MLGAFIGLVLSSIGIVCYHYGVLGEYLILLVCGLVGMVVGTAADWLSNT